MAPAAVGRFSMEQASRCGERVGGSKRKCAIKVGRGATGWGDGRFRWALQMARESDARKAVVTRVLHAMAPLAPRWLVGRLASEFASPMTTHTDADLVERMKRGEGGAFGLLVKRHQDAVFSLCYHLSGDAAEAEDLVQEAFLRCHAQIGRYRADAPFWPWLRWLRVRSALNGLPGRRNRPWTLSLDAGSSRRPSEAPIDVPADAHGRAIGRASASTWDRHGDLHARVDLERPLADLAPVDRAILMLRYLEDMACADIAAALGVRLSTVETRLFRARKRLDALIRAQGHADVEVQEGQHVATPND